MSNTNYFVELNNINVNEKVEKKNGLSYLSWAWAWAELKKRHPDASYKIYENADGWNYHHDQHTAWVKVGVTVNNLEHIEYLPIMDYKNKSIPLENISSFEVNKAIQRALTKAIARHGVGLYIYAGEDLPEETDGKTTVNKTATAKTPRTATTQKTAAAATPKPTTTTPAATATATPQKAGAGATSEPDTWRAKLRKYIKATGIEPNAIIQVCGLNVDSSEDEWKAAYEYAVKTFGEVKTA